MNPIELLHQLSIFAIPLLFAITLHEAAHGWAAYYYGDRTAWYLGRLSLNPIRHLDPVGSVILPLLLLFLRSPFLFGWAKPVPVNSRNLTKPRWQLPMIALAGPAANILMTCLWALIAKLCLLSVDYSVLRSIPAWQWLLSCCSAGIQVNIVLAVFNLLPIPPLDGSKVLACLLPRAFQPVLEFLEDYGIALLLILLMTGILGSIISPLLLWSIRATFRLFNLYDLIFLTA